MLSELKGHCSPSRLNCFLRNKREFLQTYLFKKTKPTTKAQESGKLNHEYLASVVNQEFEKLIVKPSFGSLRKTETVSSEVAKANREMLKEWELAHAGDMVVSESEYEMFISLKSLFNTSETLRKALTIAIENNYQGIEKVIHLDNPKIKGVADIITLGTCIDIKTTYKSNWLEEGQGSEFFRYNELQSCIQGVFYTEILNKKFDREFDFYWLLVCSSYPYGNKLVYFDQEYFEDVRKIVFERYLPQYERFCNTAKEIVGYDFFLKEKYEGDPIEDWTKLDKILREWQEKNKGQIAEEATPSYYAKQKLEIDLGYTT